MKVNSSSQGEYPISLNKLLEGVEYFFNTRRLSASEEQKTNIYNDVCQWYIDVSLNGNALKPDTIQNRLMDFIVNNGVAFQ